MSLLWIIGATLIYFAANEFGLIKAFKKGIWKWRLSQVQRNKEWLVELDRVEKIKKLEPQVVALMDELLAAKIKLEMILTMIEATGFTIEVLDELDAWRDQHNAVMDFCGFSTASAYLDKLHSQNNILLKKDDLLPPHHFAFDALTCLAYIDARLGIDRNGPSDDFDEERATAYRLFQSARQSVWYSMGLDLCRIKLRDYLAAHTER